MMKKVVLAAALLLFGCCHTGDGWDGGGNEGREQAGRLWGERMGHRVDGVVCSHPNMDGYKCEVRTPSGIFHLVCEYDRCIRKSR